MKQKYESRATEWIVCKVNGTIFHDGNIRVRIEDEDAGEFVVVDSLDENGKVRINPDEWPMVKSTIQRAVELCRDDTGECLDEDDDDVANP
jgi:hypothetical protein